MDNRQTRNVSLPPHQDAFVDAMVKVGRFRTASEVVQEGIRMVEEAHHRQLLEKWMYEGLRTNEGEEQLSDGLKERARAHFQRLLDAAMQDVESGRVSDGPTAMQRLREQLEARSD